MHFVNFLVLKVWPYEESDENGFIQELFRLMCVVFAFDDSAFIEVRFVEKIFLMSIIYHCQLY